LSHLISFVRIPWLAVRACVWPVQPMGVLDEDRLRMRVWPNDIDFNLHLNNARYLNLMDYGRMHMLARTGLLRPVLRARYAAMVGAVWVTYRRSLPVFAGFELSSRLVCWDARWFYIEQSFTGRDGLAAVGWVKGVLRGKQGIVAPQELIEGVAPGVRSPAMPESIAAWNELTREKLAG